MKRILYCFFVTLLCALCLTACGGKESSSTTNSEQSSTSETVEKNIEFVQKEISLSVGDSVQAEVVTSKNNVFIFWSIRDTEIATVDDDGVITALAEGETICYAEFAGEKAKCLVKIIAPQARPMLSVSVPYENAEISLYVGDDLAIKPIVKLGDDVVEATEISYEIQADSTAISIEDGVVSGLNVGVATVSISATFEGQTAAMTLTVNVVAK